MTNKGNNNMIRKCPDCGKLLKHIKIGGLHDGWFCDNCNVTWHPYWYKNLKGGMNCKDCPMFDSERFGLYGEPICTEGDFTIRLKRGQGKPDNCPLRLNKKHTRG